MCDTRGHQHWCSNCGKNLNHEPKDSYIEIEWAQNDKGQIIEEKSMICKECLAKSDNIKELIEFFKGLEYSPFGHVFCSSCKKDLTKEFGKDIKPGIDYECLNFKCHERSGPNIKHIIKVVVLCKECVKSEFNINNLEKLKKLGKNPKFTPLIVCDKIDICKQYNKGDKSVNCKNIVIGRDRDTLHIGLLCSKKHKGTLLLPFDDGFSVIRPKKGGAAAANPINVAIASGTNPLQDYMLAIEKMLKKYKLGKFGADHSNEILALERRISNIERAFNIKDPIMVATPNIPKDIENYVEHNIVVENDNIVVENDNIVVENDNKIKIDKEEK